MRERSIGDTGFANVRGTIDAATESDMAEAFPKPTRKHVRSLLTKLERAEFDATYAGRRVIVPEQYERWKLLAATFKPEPERKAGSP